MPWLQVRLAITPEQAETYEDALLEVGAVSVTFMDAEDQPIFEPDLGTTPLWTHTHLLALFEADTDEANLVAHLELLTGGTLPLRAAPPASRRCPRSTRWRCSTTWATCSWPS